MILGEARAARVTKAMFVAFYVSIVALVIAQVLPGRVAARVRVAARSWCSTWKAYSEPKPEVSPMPNPVWPLWFAAVSFLVTRRAGGLFVLGLIVGAIVGW